MKTLVSSLILGFLLLSCSNSETKNNELPVVDVTKSYPKKEIVLQDIADVEYISLETRDDVLISDSKRLCIASPDSIFVGNYSEGSIYLFNEEGEFLNKFNHKGSSGQEYQKVWGIFYYKKNKEVIIMDSPFQYRFQVYNTSGDYIRTIPIDKKYSFNNTEMVNYGDDFLLCYDRENIFNRGVEGAIVNKLPYVLVSKLNGKAQNFLPVFVPKRVDATLTVTKGENSFIYWANLNSVIADDNGFILSEVSKDTIFTYSEETKLQPIAVREPEVLKMEEPLSLFQLEKTTKDYLFGKIIGKETEKKYKFSTRNIVIDRKTNEVHESKIVNADAPNEDLDVEWFLNNNTSLLLGADKLKDLLEEGKLKGDLKEIAEKISADDNPVLVRVK